MMFMTYYILRQDRTFNHTVIQFVVSRTTVSNVFVTVSAVLDHSVPNVMPLPSFEDGNKLCPPGIADD
jgi:hypothetical protein